MSDNEKQVDTSESDQAVEEIAAAGEQQAAGDEDIHLLLEDARNKADEHWNALLRTQAEIENLRQEMEQLKKSLRTELLEILYPSYV